MRRRPASKMNMPTKALFLLFSPLLVVLSAIYLLLDGTYRMLLRVLVWALWCSRGRDILLVYSDSPNWREYIEETILPRVTPRAVVLNWSERSQWRSSLATRVLRSIGGHKNFNPMVILFRPFRRTKVYRLWQPFQDKKHGNPATLDNMVQELFSELG